MARIWRWLLAGPCAVVGDARGCRHQTGRRVEDRRLEARRPEYRIVLSAGSRPVVSVQPASCQFRGQPGQVDAARLEKRPQRVGPACAPHPLEEPKILASGPRFCAGFPDSGPVAAPPRYFSSPVRVDPGARNQRVARGCGPSALVALGRGSWRTPPDRSGPHAAPSASPRLREHRQVRSPACPVCEVEDQAVMGGVPVAEVVGQGGRRHVGQDQESAAEPTTVYGEGVEVEVPAHRAGRVALAEEDLCAIRGSIKASVHSVSPE